MELILYLSVKAVKESKVTLRGFCPKQIKSPRYVVQMFMLLLIKKLKYKKVNQSLRK